MSNQQGSDWPLDHSQPSDTTHHFAASSAGSVGSADARGEMPSPTRRPSHWQPRVQSPSSATSPNAAHLGHQPSHPGSQNPGQSSGSEPASSSSLPPRKRSAVDAALSLSPTSPSGRSGKAVKWGQDGIDEARQRARSASITSNPDFSRPQETSPTEQDHPQSSSSNSLDDFFTNMLSSTQAPWSSPPEPSHSYRPNVRAPPDPQTSAGPVSATSNPGDSQQALPSGGPDAASRRDAWSREQPPRWEGRPELRRNIFD